jgi:signal transduction histidine kinase/CheY-like chemotaxis protein
MEAREKAGRIADVLVREEELRPFCRELLQALIDQTGSQVGAVYLRNAQKTEFEHCESIGLAAGARSSFSATEYEGEPGTVLAAGKVRRITEIPADSRMMLPGVSGDFKPQEILTVPIFSGTEVAAVISLASLNGYAPAAVRLVSDVGNMLNARLTGVLLFRQIREFSEQLEHQNRELEAQKKELAVQKDELGEQNLELEMQKKQLEEASRLKNAFLSNMSHELRTPLNAVIALSGVLRRRLPGSIPEEEFGYLEVIERNGQNLLELINNLLDLSRIEAGREEITLSRFLFQELVEETVATIEPQALEKKITLRSRVSDDLPPLHSDYVKCRHVLQNIVGNAVKFTEEGQVEIAAEAIQDGLRITVTDTGIGIPEDQVPFIFDEFRQADGSLTRRYGGSGLGLAIAKKYTLLLGGTITVKSVLGKGSTFTVRLPREAPVSGVADIREPGGRISRSELAGKPETYLAGDGPSILIVEDSEPAVIQLKEILTGQGYRVRVARNGKEALEEINAMMPNGVILDLMMPEVDGFQVLKTLRGRERTVRLPILVLTAKHITREELNVLQGNHIHQLIQKGDIGKEELLAAVGKMVAPADEAPSAPGKARKTAVSRPVILVIEDNLDHRITVKALLEEFSDVIEAADGPAGVELARRQRPDLILLDISLPGQDGFATLEELKREASLWDVPVVALTARVMQGDRKEILARGFDGYIPKPVEETYFENIVRGILYGNG